VRSLILRYVAELAHPLKRSSLQPHQCPTLPGATANPFSLQDKYLRSVADFRNLQDRTKRDIDSARQFAIQRFAGDLIESIDNLDRALEAVPQESLTPSEDTETELPPKKDLINLHAGLKMTESILMGTLKKHGLERFDPVEEGRKFDPRLDEATFMTKVEGKEDGDVFHTQSKGFTLNGRVLRAAKVGVVKNS
jgi:molecular chaperone GrpE